VQLVVSGLSALAAIVVAGGSLFWGRTVIESKDAEIDLLKKFSAAEFLPQLQAMKGLHEMELEQERATFAAAQGKEREEAAARIKELQDEIDAVTKVDAGYRRIELTAQIRGTSTVSGMVSRMITPAPADTSGNESD
jgi:hypothetical protein